MITSALISNLRREYNDLPERHHDEKTGDGTSTVYKSKFSPILEGSYSLLISNALKTENSDYTLDKDTGDIDLAAATSSIIDFKYKSVNFRDQHWLESIQGAFDSLGDQYFRTTIRESFNISASVQVYSAPSGCVRVYELLESSDYTASGTFSKPQTNWRYDKSANKIILGLKPSKANYAKISYLKRLTRPTLTSSTLDVEDKWLELIRLKAGSTYLHSMANKYAQQGNATVEEGHLSVSYLRQLANDNEIKFENLKKRLKPVMPSFEIPFHMHDGGPT